MQVYSEKITRIVEDISSLNLLEVSKAYKVLNLSTISHLMYLRQVADLNSLLKSKLNISDAPVMMAGASAPAPAAAAPVEVCCYAWYLTPAELCALFLSSLLHGQGLQKISVFKTARTGLNLKSPQEEEEQAPQVIQTSFTVKLNKFDAAKKVADKLLLCWPVFTLMIQVAIIKEIKNLVEGMNLVQVWNANFRHSFPFPNEICKSSLKTFAFYTPLSRPRSSLRVLQQLWSLTSQRMKLRKYKLLFKLWEENV